MTPAEAAEVIEMVRKAGAVRAAAMAAGIPRSRLKAQYDTALQMTGSEDLRSPRAFAAMPYVAPVSCDLTLTHTAPDCVAVAFSDAHWTTLRDPRSLAHEALLAVLPSLAPDVLLSLGDLLDMGEPSRHAPLMWQARPRVRDEIDAAHRHLADIVALAPNAERYWVRGNHDDRFDKWLAANAGSFQDVAGFSLQDHFTQWRMCWRLNINDAVAVHRYHGGVHAAWNNTIKAGVHTISGDTHALEVRPFSDLRGRRYGIQTGMLGDPAWPCFSYRLGMPGLWTPGFVVLTWRSGELLPPELCEVRNGVAWFRGQPVAGKARVRVKQGRTAA